MYSIIFLFTTLFNYNQFAESFTLKPSSKQRLTTTSLKDRNVKILDGGKSEGKGKSKDDGDGDGDANNNGAIPNLVPQENPTIRADSRSISGVIYGDVLAGLNQLYPPEELSQRNAISRKDGYWTFIEDGVSPPSQFTYGEFDFLFFADLMDRSCAHYHAGDATMGWEGKTFLDIGSGTGRLVIGAGALHPDLKCCRGLEILPGIHEVSLQNIDQCKIQQWNDNDEDEEERTESNTDVLCVTKEDKNENENGNNIILDDNSNYEEPLCSEMSEMQKALQEMTAEEWKAILGDYEFYDEDLESEEIDDDEHDHGDEEQLAENFEAEEKSMADSGGEGIGDELELEPNHTKVKVDQRQIQHTIVDSFILPSDEDLVANVLADEDEEGDGEETKDSFRFESLDEFLDISREQWIQIVGREDENKGVYPQSESSSQFPFTASEDDIGSINEGDRPTEDRVNHEQGEVQGEENDYALTFNEDGSEIMLPLAPVHFACGSFQDPYEYIGDADIVFIFSSCMTESMIGDLSDCIGRQCKPGTIVISTEFKLSDSGVIDPLEDDPNMPCGRYEIEMIENIEGFNWVTGTSTAFIHRVTKSLWDGSGPPERPALDPTQVAWNTIRDMEAGNLTNTERFIREVRNSMAFHSVLDTMQAQIEFVSNNNTAIVEDEDIQLDAIMSEKED